MATVLRRGKLFDTACVALLLLVFTLIPVVLLLRDRIAMLAPPMQAAKIALLAISWPPLIFGALTLLFFWWHGRAVDKHHLSTATARQLNYVMAAAASVLFAAVLIVASETLSLVDRIRQYPSWRLAIDAVVLLLLVFVAHSLLAFLREVRLAKRSMRQIAPVHPAPAAAPAADFALHAPQPAVV